MHRRAIIIFLLFFCSFVNADSLHDFELKAEAGDRAAQYKLGYNYYVGGGVAQDFKKVFNWYLKAAQHHHVEAQFNLARCIMRARGDTGL